MARSKEQLAKTILEAFPEKQLVEMIGMEWAKGNDIEIAVGDAELKKLLRAGIPTTELVSQGLVREFPALGGKGYAFEVSAIVKAASEYKPGIELQ